MSSAYKRRLVTALRWLISVVALFLVVHYIGPRQLLDRLSAVDRTLFALVLGLLLAEAFMRCLNWRQLARAAGSGGRIQDFLYGYFTGGFVATLLPSTLGTDAARSFFIARRTGAKIEVMLATAFAVNFLSLVALSLCALIAGLLIHVQGERLSYSSYVSLGIAAGCIVAAISVLAFVRRQRREEHGHVANEAGAKQGLLMRLRSILGRFVTTLILAGSGSVGELTRTLAISIVMCVIRIVGWTMLLVALGTQLSWATLFVLGPALLILAALPISIGGFGGMQAASVFLLTGWGVTPEKAAAWSLLQSSLYIVLNVPGAIPFLTGTASYKPFRAVS